MLSADNYQKGFLLDEELMAGITEVKPEGASAAGDNATGVPSVLSYAAYVVRHTSGEYLGYREFSSLEDALSSLNTIARDWHYESASGCGKCGDGGCKVARGEKCGHGKKDATKEPVQPPAFHAAGAQQGPSL